MRLTAERRVAILLHEGIRNLHGKTGLAYLRYGEASVVAVIDKQCAGESLAELTDIANNVPIVANLAETLVYQPDVLLIGIAPLWRGITGCLVAGSQTSRRGGFISG